jgi:hypothetical protein
VATLALHQNRLATNLDIEVGRAKHEVGKDGVRGYVELFSRVAGPGRRVRPALLEGDPLRRQEWRHRDGHDDDRRGQGNER